MRFESSPPRSASPRLARRARALAALAAATLAVGQAGLWLSIEPIATWSYDLSWWSWILLADAVVLLRTGDSLALARPRAFLALAAWSAAFWLVFEVANLRLENWYYVGIPPDVATRTLGVYVSFATVLPGVLGMHALIEGRARAAPSAAAAPRPRTRALLVLLGALCLVLPLAFPRHAYPLIWGAPFLLLEPWLAARDRRSLLARWTAGDRAPLYRLLAAGAACGLLWETWNWRSPAKWIYTVPFFEQAKLFEMPYLGFVGFVPFALGCHSAARALVVLGWIPEWEGPAESGPRARAPRAALFAFAASLAFSAVAIAAMNRATVRGLRPWIGDVPGISPEVARRLDERGIRRPEDLVAAAESGDPRLALAGAGSADLAAWLPPARLMLVRGLGRRGLSWLAPVGIDTVEELAAADGDALAERLRSSSGGLPPAPIPAEVRVWVRGARLRGSR